MIDYASPNYIQGRVQTAKQNWIGQPERKFALV